MQVEHEDEYGRGDSDEEDAYRDRMLRRSQGELEE